IFQVTTAAICGTDLHILVPGEDVQVRAADGGRGHLDDHIARIGDPGIGHGRPGLFSGPLIHQCLHGSSSRRPARLPIPRIPRTFPVRPRSTTVTRPSGDRASGGRSLPDAERMTHPGWAAGTKSTITSVQTPRAPRSGPIDPE